MSSDCVWYLTGRSSPIVHNRSFFVYFIGFSLHGTPPLWRGFRITKSPDRQNIFLFCLSGPLAHVSGLTPTLFTHMIRTGFTHGSVSARPRPSVYVLILYSCEWRHIHALVPAADAAAYHCKSACPAPELYRSSLVAQTYEQLSAIKAVCPGYAQTIPLHLFSLPSRICIKCGFGITSLVRGRVFRV